METYKVIFKQNVISGTMTVPLEITLYNGENINKIIRNAKYLSPFYCNSGTDLESKYYFAHLNTLVKSPHVKIAAFSQDDADFIFDLYGSYKTKDGVFDAYIHPFTKKAPPSEFQKYVDKLISFVYNGGTKSGQERVIRVKEVNDEKKYIDGVDVFEGETGENRRYSFDKINKLTIKVLK